MDAKQGKLIVFSAPSGSGKTTIVHHLLKQKDLNLGFSVSATSRPRRTNEEHGKDYYFITKEAFLEHIKQNDFLEWEEVYKDNFYGTLQSEIEKIWKEGKAVIFDIDVVGGLRIKNKYPQNTLAVFVQPPSKEVMEQRLRNRKTETEEKITERLNKAEKELKFAVEFDLILINDDLETAKREAASMVDSFLKKG
ncbi:MAG: guanylate kinase [Flavobacteriaceae bacterium]|nr:guanylate kinase [Flavobacteriaceae bacterium]